MMGEWKEYKLGDVCSRRQDALDRSIISNAKASDFLLSEGSEEDNKEK